MIAISRELLFRFAFNIDRVLEVYAIADKEKRVEEIKRLVNIQEPKKAYDPCVRDTRGDYLTCPICFAYECDSYSDPLYSTGYCEHYMCAKCIKHYVQSLNNA